VPFWWVLDHMLYPWLLTVGLLVGVFVVIDTIDHRRAARDHEDDAGPQVNVVGAHNFLFIGVIIYGVFRPSIFEAPTRISGLLLSREVVMLAAAVASRRLTRPALYAANDFNFGPIREVAILFVGIFSTMVPALQWLEHNADKLRLPLSRHLREGIVDYLWMPTTELMLDEIGWKLLDLIKKPNVKRVFIDGLDGMRHAASDEKRLISFFTAVANELRVRNCRM
jgi:hypothetical protein